MKKVVGITMLLIIAAAIVYIFVDLINALGLTPVFILLAVPIVAILWIIIAIRLISGGSNAKDA